MQACEYAFFYSEYPCHHHGLSASVVWARLLWWSRERVGCAFCLPSQLRLQCVVGLRAQAGVVQQVNQAGTFALPFVYRILPQ